MNFFNKFFSKKEEPIKSYSDFWNWFLKHEKTFFKVVQSKENIEKGFLDKISPKLDEIKDGYFFLTGMYNDSTVELILTADGNINNIAFVEELVAAAPQINDWKFTALKPEYDIENVNIGMAGFEFNGSNLYFYANEIKDYPDEIDISIVHDDFSEENKQAIINGTYIFLDNFLGEINLINNVDEISFVEKKEAKSDLVPIAKLKDFLKWRQKEFVEKYDGIRYNTDDDTYSLLRGEYHNGHDFVAVVNAEVLNWDSKASHPWVAILTLKYDGSENEGMPESTEIEIFDTIEEELLLELKDFNGYLNIGRQTGNSEREFYFACKDFREPSKVFHKVKQKYSDNFEIEYDIYKDKYWQSFERFIVH
jgi:hypothetical protein